MEIYTVSWTEVTNWIINSGNVAEWTMAVGAIAAFFVALSSLSHSRSAANAAQATSELAQQQFVNEIGENKRSQARFVYALIDGQYLVNAGEPLQNVGSIGSFVAPFEAVWKSADSIEDSDSHWVAKHEAFQVVFTIHNRSNEIVGPYHLSLYDKETNKPLNFGAHGDDDPILPGETRTSYFAINRTQQTTVMQLAPLLEFRDSNGRWWRRRHYDPPVIAGEPGEEFIAASSELYD